MITTTRGTPSGSSARGSAVGTTSAPTQGSGTPAVIPEMTLTLTTAGGSLDVNFSMSLDVHSNDSGTIQFYLDTVAIAGTIRTIDYTSSQGALDPAGSIGGYTFALSWRCDSLAAGSHTIDARWARTGGTLRAITTQRMIKAVEI